MTQPWPVGELPVFVDIAPGANPGASMDTWEPYWVDITKDTREAPRIVIEEGIPDEANQADPGKCSLTVNNGVSKVASTLGKVGCYSPRNPLGPYRGKLAKNTPLRIRLQRGIDTFQRTRSMGTGWGTSESGIVWSSTANLGTDGTNGRGIMNSGAVSTTAVNAGTWDFELTTGIAVDALPGTGNYKIFLINFRRNGSTNTYTFRIDFNPDATISMYLQRTIAGVQTTIIGVGTPSLGTVTANTRYNLRLKVDGGNLWGRIWNAAGAEPTNWLINSSGEGAYTLDNTSLGTNIQFSGNQIGTPATTQSYWYPITIHSYPFVGTVPEWPVKWDKSGNDSTVPISAAGVLRRLQQGKTPVRSPLNSYIVATAPVGLWMMEDSGDVDLASAQTPNTVGATLYNTDPGGWNGPPLLGGTASQYTVEVDTTISGTVPRMTPQGSWFAWFVFYMPVLPVTNPTIFRVRASGTITQWDFKISDQFGGVAYLVGQNNDGTVLVNQSISYVPGQWCVGQIEIQQTGSTFTGRIVKYQLGDGGVSGATAPAVTGSIGTPQAWSIYGQTGFQASAAGPVAFWDHIPGINIANLMLSGNGFLGEDADDRIARLCAERGVKLDLINGGAVSQLGVQSVDRFLNVLAEAAETDLGLLTEFRGGLRYRTRGRRYGQSAIMTLDFAAGHVAEPPEPTDDDQRLRNDVTVSRKSGGTARAFDQASIDAHDLYDTSYDINPSSDAVLPNHANWRLFLGTWDEMRWPSITIDLRRNYGVSNFTERATALAPGSRILLANPPSNLPIGTVDLLVEAIKTTMEPYGWRMELVCSPYGPWNIPDFRTTAGTNLVDLVGSTLASAESGALAIGATDTWSITNTGRDWTSATLPFNWLVDDEVVTVTAISGTGTQTATVTRGANGIVQAHSIGAEVHLATPLYIAL